VGSWIESLIPIETLVPESAARWRPLVTEAIQFVFTHLSPARLQDKMSGQMSLPADTPPERRLLRLIAKMPGLQKIGQVLARNPRLPPALRDALTELENGMSDVTAEEIRAVVAERLGVRFARYQVELDQQILSEASVSAVIRFRWRGGGGVFKVLKPHIPACFAEDMRLLQKLANHLATPEIDEMVTEVRLLLERELDFAREQQTLRDAGRIYRSSLGVRIPKVIKPLCADGITAMSEEMGVKVTDAVRGSPIRQRRVADQLVQALVAAPLLSSRDPSIFHADPHAGNLLYDEPNRELIVLDWALAERIDLTTRRHLVLLGIMMTLENVDGVKQAIRALRRADRGKVRQANKIIDRAVDGFFSSLTPGHTPGVLDGMRVLDGIALQGVQFTAPLFLFRKSLFTLDGVLRDVAGAEVRMDYAIVRYFLTRWAGSFGLFYSPLSFRDFLDVEWTAVRRLLTGSGRTARGSTPSPKTKSPRPAKSRRPAPLPPQSRRAG
jgi:predicted unusual protein kinase regulating ubiquinone biosynthesis (AarF/ABC1/UbiB family)